MWFNHGGAIEFGKAMLQAGSLGLSTFYSCTLMSHVFINHYGVYDRTPGHDPVSFELESSRFCYRAAMSGAVSCFKFGHVSDTCIGVSSSSFYVKLASAFICCSISLCQKFPGTPSLHSPSCVGALLSGSTARL